MEILIDKKLKNKLSALPQVKGAEVIVCQYVTKIHKKSKAPKIPFMLSDNSIFLFEKPALSKSYAVSSRIWYDEIEEAILINREQFEIQYKSDHFRIEHETAQFIFKTMVIWLISTLPPSDLPKFTFDQPSIGHIEPLPDSFICRFIFLMAKKNQPLPNGIIDQIHESLAQPTKFDLNKFVGQANLLDTLLDCLQVQPSIDYLIFPKFNQKAAIRSLSQFLFRNTTIRQIMFEDSLDREFRQICEALKFNAASPLSFFGFTNTQITQDFLPYIQLLLESHKFSGFFLINSISFPVLDSLLSTPKIVSNLQTVTSINIEKVNNLSIDVFMKKMPWLVNLALKSCNMEIVSTLSSISGSCLKSLYIEGGCSSADSRSKQIVLPQSLTYLNLGSITWTGDSISEVFRSIMAHKPTDGFFHLSIDSAFFGTRDLLSFAEGLANLQPSPLIKYFQWSNSAVHQKFFSFFSKMAGVESLSLAGSMSPQFIKQFVELCCSLPKLHCVNVSGGSQAKLGIQCAQLFKGLQNCKQLQQLIVDDQSFSDEGLTELAELLCSNKKISSVSLAGNSIRSADAFGHFFDRLMERGPPLELPFPATELEIMKKNKLVGDTQIEKMEDCWSVIRNGTQNAAAEEVSEGNLMNEASEEKKSSHSTAEKVNNEEDAESHGSHEAKPLTPIKQSTTPKPNIPIKPSMPSRQNSSSRNPEIDADFSDLSAIPPPENAELLKTLSANYSFEASFMNLMRSS